jgi:phage terminase large subunit GpA-like protein
MDRDALDAFVRQTWRSWSGVSLRTLAAAVDYRRAQLDGE